MLLEKFKKYIATNYQLTTTNSQMLLAVRGGVDSVVMVDLFAKAGYNFSIAHCNFQLRGDESLRDELFVKSLGEKYQKKVFVKRFETATYATHHKVSIQVAARQLRYTWFNEIVDSSKFEVSSLESSTSNYQLATSNVIATAASKKIK